MDKQLKSIEHLLYPVEKVPSKDLLPNHLFTPQQEYAIVVKTPKGDKIVNHCSKGYHLVPNSDIVHALLEAFQDTGIQIIGTSKLDSRFSIDMVFDKAKTGLKNSKGDILKPKLRIANSYDGRVKYSYQMGIFREVCTNGMVVPAEGFEHLNMNLKMRHTPSLEEFVDPEEILVMVSEFQMAMQPLLKPYEELQKKKVDNLEDRVMEVIGETKFSSRRAEDVLDRIEEEMGLLKASAPTDWLVYSGLNYQLNHNKEIKMDAHKKEKLDQQVLTYLINN